MDKVNTNYGTQQNIDLDNLIAQRKAIEPQITTVIRPSNIRSNAMSRKSVTPSRPLQNFEVNIKESLVYEADDDEETRPRPKSVLRPIIQRIIDSSKQKSAFYPGASTPNFEQLNNL